MLLYTVVLTQGAITILPQLDTKYIARSSTTLLTVMTLAFRVPEVPTTPPHLITPVESTLKLSERIVSVPLLIADEFPPEHTICASCDPMVSVLPYILMTAVVPVSELEPTTLRDCERIAKSPV